MYKAKLGYIYICIYKLTKKKKKLKIKMAGCLLQIPIQRTLLRGCVYARVHT